MLSAKDVTKHRGSQLVLDRVSLSVGPAGRLGVVGPNGIGKSTLLRILAGLDTQSSGTLRIEAPRIVVAGYAAERIKVDGRIERRRIALNALASAYGAAATVTGQLTLPDRAEAAVP